MPTSRPEITESSRLAYDGAQELRMTARVVGDGPPLVLVGGGLTGWASWAPHAERLAATRTVARLQLLSVQFGLEDRPLPEAYSVRLESVAMAAALDALGWTGPLDLVAWSYGGVITLDYAMGHPERVRTLTLIEPPARWVLREGERDYPDLQALVRLAASIPQEVGEAELVTFVETVALAPPGTDPRTLPQWPTWMEHRRSLRNTTAPFDHRDDPARLSAFERPVLLVTGTGTSPFLRAVHETLDARLPRSRSVEMPAGHAPHLVSMDRFLEALERFHEAPGGER